MEYRQRPSLQGAAECLSQKVNDRGFILIRRNGVKVATVSHLSWFGGAEQVLADFSNQE